MLTLDEKWNGRKHVKIDTFILEVRDKNKSKKCRPFAWLLVQRKETYEYAYNAEKLNGASIELSYRRIGPGSRDYDQTGRFDGSYSSFGNAASLTAQFNRQGAVFLDPADIRGQRIGTYFLNLIIRWLQKQWPTAKVNTVNLLALQAKDKNSKVRRNRFYEQFGLKFNYTDEDKKEGRSKPVQVSALTPVVTWRNNITIHDDVGEYLSREVSKRVSLETSFDRLNTKHGELADKYVGASLNPFRWAIWKWYKRSVGLLRW